MLAFLRHHRQRLGRSLAGLFALVWLTVALQPCATAQEHAPSPPRHETAAPMDHAAMGHGMDHGAMDHGAADHALAAGDPCPPGTECPVFKAVDEQAAAKAADPLDLPLQPVPAALLSFPLPAPQAVRAAFHLKVDRTPIPAPPILEFRVLLI